MIRGRFKARQILHWVLRNYTFEDGHSIESFYWSYLAYQSHALLNGKIFAEEDEIYSANEKFIAHQLERLINKTFLPFDQFWDHWQRHSDVETFAWPSTETFVVKVKDPGNLPLGMSTLSLLVKTSGVLSQCS